jgi:sec-independent protein translocase protein TatA
MGLDNPLHLAFLVVLLLLVFGARRLPEMGRSLGAGMRGFKESINGDSSVSHITEMSESTTAGQPAVETAHPQPGIVGEAAHQA